MLEDASHAMGEHNDDDDVISRLEWINFCAPPRELQGQSGYYETFSATIRKLFDNVIAHRSHHTTHPGFVS